MQKTCQRSHWQCERFNHDFVQLVAQFKRAHDPFRSGSAYCGSERPRGRPRGFEPDVYRDGAPQRRRRVTGARTKRSQRIPPVPQRPPGASLFLPVSAKNEPDRSGLVRVDARASAGNSSFPERRMGCPLSANPAPLRACPTRCVQGDAGLAPRAAEMCAPSQLLAAKSVNCRTLCTRLEGLESVANCAGRPNRHGTAICDRKADKIARRGGFRTRLPPPTGAPAPWAISTVSM